MSDRDKNEYDRFLKFWNKFSESMGEPPSTPPDFETFHHHMKLVRQALGAVGSLPKPEGLGQGKNPTTADMVAGQALMAGSGKEFRPADPGGHDWRETRQKIASVRADYDQGLSMLREAMLRYGGSTASDLQEVFMALGNNAIHPVVQLTGAFASLGWLAVISTFPTDDDEWQEFRESVGPI